MYYLEEIIQRINCFQIQKVSNHGSLILYQTRMAFVYDDGNVDRDFNFEYSNISQIKIDPGILRSMDVLQIDANGRSYKFSGVKDIENAKNLISLLVQHNSKPQNSYGFINTGEAKVEWKDLDDPILFCSYSLPADMKTVSERILGNDFFVELYTTCGSEQIVIDEWSQKNGYQERTIHYQKTINIPFMGKNIIKIAEKQILFIESNRMAMQIVSNLGKTPYADCFDPQVQILFEDKGATVDFLVKFKLVWISEPAFKSIIDSKTTEANHIFYIGFGKQLMRELGGSDIEKVEEKNENDANEENDENEVDEFSKIRKLYKAVIILLLFFLFVAVYYRVRKQESFFFSFWKFILLIVFLVLLVNF